MKLSKLELAKGICKLACILRMEPNKEDLSKKEMLAIHSALIVRDNRIDELEQTVANLKTYMGREPNKK